MLASLLVANRGEIAVRILRTARRLGMRTVAVYSQADAHALHVTLADDAICLGPPTAADSYLNIERVLAAANATAVEAIHPGYGFLSENAEFAGRCRAAGMEFVGPDERAIRVMGSKSAAKDAVAAVGVPTLPGYQGAHQDDASLRRAADAIGYPLLVKAVAGGGGKGMRIVRAPEMLADALAAARREAQAAFGDASVLLERFLERPRHIEVQVFGDRHGNVVHLYERDCSLQRRHQKVVEEAPAPFLSEALRQRLGAQAVAAARAVSYVGAGTVEFLCEGQEAWFIEMNTRLQVEHPVTEAITGLDLVEWQLRVASGEPLPLRQEQIRAEGHAIELRLCAEDATRELLPAIGRLECFELVDRDLPWKRLDAGFRGGDVVTPYYDSLLAKLIVHAPDRARAIERARLALGDLRIAGVATNRSFLQVLLDLPAWQQDTFDTNLIQREQTSLLAAAAARDLTTPPAIRALLAVALISGRSIQPTLASPWDRSDVFRANLPRRSTLWLAPDASMTMVEACSHQCWRVSQRVDGDRQETVTLNNVHWKAAELSAECAGRLWRGRVLRSGNRCTWVGADGTFVLQLVESNMPSDSATGVAGRSITAPMPGQVLAVHVSAGDRVERGSRLLTLEAMKMEHTLTATGAATVSSVDCRAGQRVADGAVLVRLEPIEDRGAKSVAGS